MAAPRIVRVLTDVAALDRTFDYAVPGEWLADGRGDQLRVGSMVRADLHGRRVAGWVVGIDTEPPPGVELHPLTRLSGEGPPRELVDLASWASRRWIGPRASFLRTASPDRMVSGVPHLDPVTAEVPDDEAPVLAEAFSGPGRTIRIPPASDFYPLALAVARRGNALVLAPSVDEARQIAARLVRDGHRVAVHPRDWALGMAGTTVVGTRAAAWAPVGGLAAVVVIDEHDEVYQSERAPTWHARDVAVERADRAGVPCVLASPIPSLEARRSRPLLEVPRAVERDDWPLIEVVDQRDQDPRRSATYSEALVKALRGGGRVACVLNRTGRSRLLACGACGELAVCERCGASLIQDEAGRLVCTRCDLTRPLVCASCGATRLKNLRVGVSRAREELEALARAPVVEVTGASVDGDARRPRLLIGTEAVLHRCGPVDAVAFLDFDQELMAPRYRVGEEALALLVRAGRLVGGRRGDGRVIVQTRQPEHPVIQAAVRADPEPFSQIDAARRRLLGYPPFRAVAEISGPGAELFVGALGLPMGVEVAGPRDGAWLVRAESHEKLSATLLGIKRPKERVRIAVDPLRI